MEIHFAREAMLSSAEAALPRPVEAARRAEFRLALLNLAGTFIAFRGLRDRPAPSVRQKRLLAIASASKQLLTALSIPHDVNEDDAVTDSMPRWLQVALALSPAGGTVDLLEDVARGVARLRDWSAAAAAVDPDSKGGDQDIDDALISLARIYREFGGKRPGASRSTGIAGGPFIRFALAFFHGVGLRLTAEAVASRWAKTRRLA